jgi:hypothetical protein
VEIKVIQELKRRGYQVVETPDKGLLIEKETFWGHFGYDTGIGRSISHIKWGRHLLFLLFYGAGIMSMLYWVFLQKEPMKEEVLGITAGR